MLRPAVLSHLCRSALCLGFLGWALASGRLEAIAVTTLWLYFALFTFQHDLLHGALGLKRALREPLLAAVGALILSSGHSVRVVHLLHHHRPLAPEDLESAAVRGSVFTALPRLPGWLLAYRAEAWRRAGAHERRWIGAETLLNAALLLGLTLVPALQVVALVMLTLQLSAPIWAGRIPHRTPEALMRLARRLSFTRSPTFLSLAFHELHHAHPKVPVAELPALSASLAR